MKDNPIQRVEDKHIIIREATKRDLAINCFIKIQVVHRG